MSLLCTLFCTAVKGLIPPPCARFRGCKLEESGAARIQPGEQLLLSTVQNVLSPYLWSLVSSSKLMAQTDYLSMLRKSFSQGSTAVEEQSDFPDWFGDMCRIGSQSFHGTSVSVTRPSNPPIRGTDNTGVTALHSREIWITSRFSMPLERRRHPAIHARSDTCTLHIFVEDAVDDMILARHML